MNQDLILLGGGGFAKEVAEIAEMTGYTIAGYVAATDGVLDAPRLGDFSWVAEQDPDKWLIAPAFGAVDRRTIQRRSTILKELADRGFGFASLVSPHATKARGVELGTGVFVAHNVVISVDARIGNFAILNSSAIIGHDAQISQNSVIAPGAFIGGETKIGERCLIGPGAQVLQGLSVGADSIISVSATVLRDASEKSTAVPPVSKIL